MKKILLVILFLLLFPSMVLAKDTCNSNDIKIEEIRVEEKEGYTEEVTPVSIDNNKINLNLEMYNVGESITYKIKVKNNSNNDYYFTKDSFNLNTDYIEYSLLNDSEVIKSNEEKEIELKITYKNKTPEDEFNENNMMSITLSDTPLSNPSTKRTISLILLVIFITIIVITINKNKKLSKVLIGLTLCFIPLSIKALCTINLEVNANITINEKEAIFLPGPEVNVKMKELAGDDTSTLARPYTFQDVNITAIKYSNTEPEESEKEEKNIVSTIDSPYPIYMWYEEGTIYWWSEAKHPKLNKDSSIFMYNLSSLNEVTSISLWDVSSIVNMQSMFYGTALVNLYDIKDWNIENVENLIYTFSHMEHLTDIKGLSNWNTKNINSLQNSFSSDSSLVDLSGLETWNTSNVTNMCAMFLYSEKIQSLEPIRNWDTSNVTNFSIMFGYNNTLTSLEPIRNWDTSNVIYFSGMFAYNNALSSLEPLRNWNTSKVTNMQSMFNHCISLTSLQGLENWDTSSVTTMFYMFHNCVNLMDASAISNWDISNVENLGYMFNISNDVATTQKYSSLPKLDIKNWDTSKVKNYAYFIEGLRYVETEFTVRNPNIESYYGMFGDAAHKGGKITINYTAETEAIVDEMIKTKEKNGNVVKGSLVE